MIQIGRNAVLKTLERTNEATCIDPGAMKQLIISEKSKPDDIRSWLEVDSKREIVVVVATQANKAVRDSLAIVQQYAPHLLIHVPSRAVRAALNVG